MTPIEAAPLTRVPETYDELIEALNASNGEPVRCTAWAVGGGDPENLEIQTARSKFTNAWVVFGPRGGERVRLSRLESTSEGLNEVVRYVSPDFIVTVEKRT